ncbi:MAG: hypothetical protein JHC93_03815 [Parachlamydiales bacterium]|nr:hypothetical protein [Parachlamydiales bacterium]
MSISVQYNPGAASYSGYIPLIPEKSNATTHRFKEIQPGSHEVQKTSKVAGAVLVSIGIILILASLASLIIFAHIHMFVLAILLFVLLAAPGTASLQIGMAQLEPIITSFDQKISKFFGFKNN